MFPFYTPWKYQKTFGFLFSGGIIWEHWQEMDLQAFFFDRIFPFATVTTKYMI